MRRPKRNHTAAFKAKVAVVALKGDKTLSELPEKSDLHTNQITQWGTQLLEGATEVSLDPAEKRDTGPSTKDMIEAVARRIPLRKLAGHYHDTCGMAAANIYAPLQMNIGIFGSSVAGLGGCPYAAGASGNVATEDVVWLMRNLGLDTGMGMDGLVGTGAWISDRIGRPPNSKVAIALLAQMRSGVERPPAQSVEFDKSASQSGVSGMPF